MPSFETGVRLLKNILIKKRSYSAFFADETDALHKAFPAKATAIVDADMIVVMDQGEVVEAGTHFELLENDGPYARLYKIQFSHQKAGKPETQEV